MPDQVAPDHGACPSHSSPAVDIHGQPFGKGLVNAVQDLNHFSCRRDVEIPDRMPRNLDGHSKAFRDSVDEFLVRDESFVPIVGLVLFHQVNDSSDPAIDESADLFLSFLTVLGAGIRACQKVVRDDPIGAIKRLLKIGFHLSISLADIRRNFFCSTRRADQQMIRGEIVVPISLAIPEEFHPRRSMPQQFDRKQLRLYRHHLRDLRRASNHP